MGWAVGWSGRRWVGYGVPAICDFPGCGTEIDRGVSYVCGGMHRGGDHGCGRYFCSELVYVYFRDGEIYDEEAGEERGESLYELEVSGEVECHEICPRCAKGEQPFEPTPDLDEWLVHQLTDETWRVWRDENPAEVRDALQQVAGHPVFNHTKKPARPNDMEKHQVWAWMNSSGYGHPGHWAIRGTGVIF